MASRQSPKRVDLLRLSECVDRTIGHENQTPRYGQSRIRSLEWIAKVLPYLKRRKTLTDYGSDLSGPISADSFQSHLSLQRTRLNHVS